MHALPLSIFCALLHIVHDIDDAWCLGVAKSAAMWRAFTAERQDARDGGRERERVDLVVGTNEKREEQLHSHPSPM